MAKRSRAPFHPSVFAGPALHRSPDRPASDPADPMGRMLLVLASSMAIACVYHDKCIGIEVPGTNHCITITNATGTSNGAPGVTIQNELVFPRGCKCLDQEEQAIMNTGPSYASAYELLRLEIELLARQDCVAMAQSLGFSDETV